MDKAYIHTSISTSLQVAELSLIGQVLFDRMPAHADHQGRSPGDPRKVKAIVIPLIETSLKEVAEQLQKMHDLGLIIRYEVGGERFIQLVSWWKFQDRRFAHPSKYPAPEGWKDRLRFHHPVTHKLIEINWEGRYAEPRESGRKDPTQGGYIGDLHRNPTQGAYETKECAPSASDTASDTACKNQGQSPSAAAREKKPSAPPHTETDGKYFDRLDAFFNALENGSLEEWRAAYPAIPIEAELLRAKVWLKGNPEKRKKNLRRFVVAWLARAQEKGGAIGGRGAQGHDVEHRAVGLRGKYAGI